MRPSVTRTSRNDPRGAALESVAAEFALLAQRRARLARQLDLLGRQLAAASVSLDAVHGRMALLAQRMDGIDPSLRAGLAEPPPPVVAPAAPVRGGMHAARLAPATAAYQPAHADTTQATRLLGLSRPSRAIPRRRPFLPE
jgi:uncharacterized coiled-coil protein SlyX